MIYLPWRIINTFSIIWPKKVTHC